MEAVDETGPSPGAEWVKESSWGLADGLEAGLESVTGVGPDNGRLGFKYLKLVGLTRPSRSILARFFRRPPLMLATKIHSMPKNLQLEQIRGWSGTILLSLLLVLMVWIGSPSHLIFFSRQDKQALRATGRLADDVAEGGVEVLVPGDRRVVVEAIVGGLTLLGEGIITNNSFRYARTTPKLDTVMGTEERLGEGGGIFCFKKDVVTRKKRW